MMITDKLYNNERIKGRLLGSIRFIHIYPIDFRLFQYFDVLFHFYLHCNKNVHIIGYRNKICKLI